MLGHSRVELNLMLFHIMLSILLSYRFEHRREFDCMHLHVDVHLKATCPPNDLYSAYR